MWLGITKNAWLIFFSICRESDVRGALGTGMASGGATVRTVMAQEFGYAVKPILNRPTIGANLNGPCGGRFKEFEFAYERSFRTEIKRSI